MPQKRTIAKARKDRRAGKAPSTQAGEFVQEEIHKIHRGAHGARSPEQAIAIGLSMARRAGVKLRPPAKGKAKASTRKSAKYAYAAGQPGRSQTCNRKAQERDGWQDGRHQSTVAKDLLQFVEQCGGAGDACAKIQTDEHHGNNSDDGDDACLRDRLRGGDQRDVSCSCRQRSRRHI